MDIDLTFTELQSAVSDMVDITTKWMGDDVLSPHLNTPDIEDSLDKLREGDTVLVMGEMGAGKSTFINSLVGEFLLPTSGLGGGGVTHDTLTVIEFYNNIFLPEGEIELRIVLKSHEQWFDDFRHYLSSLKRRHFRRDAQDGSIGAPTATDILRAVYPLCYDPAGDEYRANLLSWIEDETTQDHPPELYNDRAILRALDPSLRLRVLRFRASEDVRNALDLLCRAHDPKLSPATFSSDSFNRIRDLVSLGDPWPLVHQVTISCNTRSRGILPPFLRILDTPGMGGVTLNGHNVTATISRTVVDRTVSQIWYVNKMERCVDAKAQYDGLSEIEKFGGLNRLKFIYTRKDVCPTVDENATRKMLRSNLMDETEDKELEIPENITSNMFFVSAFGHAVLRDLPLEINAATASTMRQLFQTAEDAHVIDVVRDLWGEAARKWEDYRGSMKIMLEKVRDACLGFVGEIQKIRPDKILDIQTLFAKFKGVEKIAKEATRPLEEFKIRVIRDRVKTTPELRQKMAQAVSVKLSSLRPQTLNALIKNKGKFESTGPAGSVNIGEMIWQEIDANPKLNIPAKDFKDLFNRFQGHCEVVIDEVVKVLTTGAEDRIIFEIDLVRRNAKRAMCDNLRTVRQYYSQRERVGEVLRGMGEYGEIWDSGQIAWDSDQGGAKKKRACETISAELSKIDLVPSAALVWGTRLCSDMNKLEIELNSLCVALNQVLYPLATKIPDPRKCLDRLVLFSFISQDKAIPRAEPVVIAVPRAEPVVAQGHADLWISGNGAKSDYVLLFRGLCGFVEDSSRRPFLFEHQDNLRAIVPEYDRTLANPPVGGEPTQAELSLAEALARSSAAALVEATLRQETQPASPQVAPPSFPQDLIQAGDDILNAMRNADTVEGIPHTDAWRCFQVSGKRRVPWLTPALHRQSLYTNTTSEYLKDWVRFRKLDTTGDQVDCPFSAHETGNMMRAWFHWRWCSREFRLFRNPDFETIHPNPFVSSSQQPEHALRYAAGLKSYRVGQNAATLLPISYSPEFESLTKQILGVVIVFAIRKSYIDDPRNCVNVVLQLLRGEQIAIKGGECRIGAEAEVTMYGRIPPPTNAYIVFRFPLFAPDLHQHNIQLENFFGITPQTPDRFLRLREAARELTAATAQNSDAAKLKMRSRLVVALGRHIQNTLAPLGFTVNIQNAVLARGSE